MIVTFGFVLLSKTKTKVANVRIVIVNARIAQDEIAIVADWIARLCELFIVKNSKHKLYIIHTFKSSKSFENLYIL